jgi:protein-disulfide isomerase
MWTRLRYGRGPQLAAAFLLALFAVSTVLAVTRAGAGGNSRTTTSPDASGRAAQALFAGIPQHGLTLGDSKAPATLVEFADPQCPFCAQYARDALPAVVDQWVRTGRLRLELRFLTFIGPGSVLAARVADAAARQNRLWTFSDVLYLNQGPENSGYVTTAFLQGIATATPGLDVNRALADSDSSQVTAQLTDAARTADSLGVTSTPSFFLVRPGRRTIPVRPSSLTGPGLSTAIERALATQAGPGGAP